MTAAENPSGWYTALWTYKGGNPREYMPIVSAVAWYYLHVHWDHVGELLGGPPTVLTIVPSKRKGVSFDTQPLRKALDLARRPPLPLSHTLTFAGTVGTRHGRYFPEGFEPGPTDVSDERVILIEDTWVSGATALSAAGALLNRGAESVATLPIARMVEPHFWNSRYGGHPYLGVLEKPYDPAEWPRE